MSDQPPYVRSTRVIALLTAFSRVLGLIREITLGYYFGASGALSAFRIAFMLPNLARRLFGEGALSSAVIPVLSETLHREGEAAARRFIGRLLPAVAALLVVGVLVADLVLLVWDSLRPDPVLELAALLMPYMVLICLTAVIGAVLNVRGRFAVPALTPVLLNLGVITAAVLGGWWWGLRGTAHIRVICYGVLLAGIGQLILSGVALRRAHFAPSLGWDLQDGGLRRVVRMMGPMVIGLSAVQINSLADYLIAYVFVTERGERVGPAVLAYAQFLYQLPLGVFGVALATAVFPELARRGAENDRIGLGRILGEGLRLGLFIALPASVGLMFIAHPLIDALYHHGRFDAGNVRRVAGALVFYAIGMIGYFSQHLIVRTYYALHDSRTPARIALGMVCANVLLNLVLVFFMAERGLALATSLCALAQVAWLVGRLGRHLEGLKQAADFRKLWRIVAACGVMTVALSICTVPAVRDRLMHGGAIVHTICLLAVGVGTYVAACRIFSVEELGKLLRSPSVHESSS